MARCSTPRPIYKSSRRCSKKRAALVTGKWYNRKRLVHYTSPFRLLDLAPLVTAQIWRECLTAEKPIKVCAPPYPERSVFFRHEYAELSHIRMLSDPIGIDINVLRVCRRVWDEAKLAIYQANTFDYGFFYYTGDRDALSREFHEYIPDRTSADEKEKWRHNDFFSLVANDSPESLPIHCLFIAIPPEKFRAIRTSVSPLLQHASISVHLSNNYDIWGPPTTFSLSDCIPDEEDATRPKFFECIEDLSQEDIKTQVIKNREAEQEFHKLLGLWKAATPERIQLSVSFSIKELKEGRETRMLMPLEEVIDPDYVAVRDRNWVRLNDAWLEPVGTWRGIY
ncbi:hypothetical protein H2200_001968 [Cladophialophora chaetospira]|uniref:Uncharacterized protein n=1 Tax=Cladophialophora chaetospira TaxID=386627 RepID=A0AA38XLY7_9EURO|nr:hypothetical protein H2200_001968 [Cladophialophora chaetospira]